MDKYFETMTSMKPFAQSSPMMVVSVVIGVHLGMA